MPDTIRCKDIIEAIQILEPDNVLTNCRDRGGFATKHISYQTLSDTKGRRIVVENTGKYVFYRGENADYPTCRPSLYRLASREEQVRALLKTYEFRLFLSALPEVQLFIRQNMYFDSWAIAQHYEFATNLIDLSDDIGVAAFFATHSYDHVTREYRLVTKGIGRIRYIKERPIPEGRFYPIGQQPFARPGRQSGYAYRMTPGEDFADESSCIEFVQSHEMNSRLETAMLDARDYFFPYEQIEQMARMIKRENIVTRKAIEWILRDTDTGNYYSPFGITEEEIQTVIEAEGIFVTDVPVVCPEALPPQINGFLTQRKIVTRPAYAIR